MSDVVDSGIGGPDSTRIQTQSPRQPGASFLKTGPTPPSPNGYYAQSTTPNSDTQNWAVVGSAIVVVALLIWIVGSLLSSSDPDTVTDNSLGSSDSLGPATPEADGDSIAGADTQADIGTQAVDSVVPFSSEEPDSGDAESERPVLAVTTVPPSSTTTTAPSSTTAPTTTPPTTAAPTTAAPTTEAPTTTAAPTTETPTTEAPVSTAAPTTIAPTTQPAAPKGNDSAAQQEVLAFTNQARADNGCAALALNNQLNTAADSHSEDMASRGYFDHNSPEGEGPGVRVDAAGYTGRGWGENIAQGYGSASAVVEGWMNSPGHRANILNCEFSELGVGYAEGATRGNVPGIYWTQVFGIR